MPALAPLPPEPPRRRGRRARRLAAGAGAVLAGALAADGCARPDGARAGGAADTLYLGTTEAPEGAGDLSVWRGVALAVDQLNAERAPGARPFGVRTPPASPDRGRAGDVARAAFLRDDSAVVAVVGPVGSGAALDAAPVFGDADRGGARAVAAVTPSASNPAVAPASPWVFRACPSDDDAAVALARFAADSLGARRVAVVFRNDLFGRGFTARVAPELEARGVRVTERDPYLADVTRYEAYAARIARRGTEALLLAGVGRDAGALVRAVRAAGGRPVVLGTDDLGRGARTLAADPATRAVHYVSFAPPAGAAGRAADRGAAAFAARYRRAFDGAPDHRAALSYDAALLAGRAAARAAAAGVRGAQPLRRAVRDRLARVGREDPAFAGVTGPLRFDAQGGAVGRPVWVARVDGRGGRPAGGAS